MNSYRKKNPKRTRMQKYERKLKNFLIKPKYQLNHAAFTVGAMVLGNGIFAAGTIFYINNVFATDSFDDVPALKAELILFVGIAFFAASLCTGLTLVIMNIIHTHRVFGSLHAIERHLQKLIDESATTPLRIRSNDQSGEIVELINKLSELTRKMES